MSALQQAVAHAIRLDSRLPWHTVQEANLAAGVAIDVVLAEASDALGRQQSGINEELRPFIYCDVARAVLTALREQA